MAAGDLGLYGLVLFAWGTSWIGMHHQVGVVAPEVSVAWRFWLAAGAMLLIAAFRRERLAYGLADHARFAAMGVLMFSSNFMMFYHGAAVLPSGLLAVVFSLASIVNLALAALLGREKVSLRLVLGATLGTTGIALLFAPELLGASFDRSAALGLALCVAGTFSFCLGNLLSQDSQRRKVAVIPGAAFGMTYGALWASFVALALGRPFILDWSAPYVGSLVFLALSASVLAFYAYLTLLGRIGAGRAGYATVMFPVVALAISTAYEGYQWTPLAMAGAALALAGNLLVLGARRAPVSR
jgi:drug/metabolite transporter (DMT)-like permease